MDILERATQRKKLALEILEKLNLLERWAAIGETYLVGAAAYDLIVSHDIDIETFSEAPNVHKVFELLTSLSSDPNVVQIKYHNYMDSPFNGLYFKLLYRDSQLNVWNIDMWLFSNDHKGPQSKNLVQDMLQTLTDDMKISILLIKEELVRKDIKYSSIYIYQAVIDYNIRTTEEFFDWVKTKEMNKLTTWKPKIRN
ncbi:hypothetical protein [Bacillus solimangrovi]|uniref:Polymerase nucleotidyl transferase domain-containing protein n=1 Tax=Bacillus solimangrovi TaxID=1305675 RepID=A0A1E5LIA1_9BACI|nr:hypothetical protein [Bacillus solimangrovi]OEH93813.1 hypothetical protein BFG57_10845 [Bacillus solimangrovi]